MEWAWGFYKATNNGITDGSWEALHFFTARADCSTAGFLLFLSEASTRSVDWVNWLGSTRIGWIQWFGMIMSNVLTGFLFLLSPIFSCSAQGLDSCISLLGSGIKSSSDLASEARGWSGIITSNTTSLLRKMMCSVDCMDGRHFSRTGCCILYITAIRQYQLHCKYSHLVHLDVTST